MSDDDSIDYCDVFDAHNIYGKVCETPNETLLVRNAGDDFSVLDCPEFRHFSHVTMIDPRDGKKFVQQIIKKMTQLSQTCKISQEIVGGKTVCIIFKTDSKTICYKPGKVNDPDEFTAVYNAK